MNYKEMCGRFQLSVKGKEISERFNTEVFDELHKPSFNCAPGQILPVITDNAPHRISLLLWGLVPSWSKASLIGNKNFNCRSESINEKPSFREPFRRQRCLVPANGYYEWKSGALKQAYRIFLKDDSLFAMAGIWDIWKSPDGGQLHSFSILTTEANELTAGIHQRMPLILSKEMETRWLYTTDYKQLFSLLKPFPAEQMDYYPVSHKVNSVGNDGDELVQRMPGQMDLFGG